MPSPAVNYKTIADSVATLLFPRAEVVLYDLAKQKTVHIATTFPNARSAMIRRWRKSAAT